MWPGERRLVRWSSVKRLAGEGAAIIGSLHRLPHISRTTAVRLNLRISNSWVLAMDTKPTLHALFLRRHRPRSIVSLYLVRGALAPLKVNRHCSGVQIYIVGRASHLGLRLQCVPTRVGGLQTVLEFYPWCRKLCQTLAWCQAVGSALRFPPAICAKH